MTSTGSNTTSPEVVVSTDDDFSALMARCEELHTLNCRYGLRLLDNARMFAESAIEYAENSDPAQRMFVILHIATALELLLKAKLALRHQKYLVAGNTVVTMHQFDKGDFKSIDVEECIRRLKLYCGFELNDNQRRVITALRNLRNRFAHYVELSNDTASHKAAAAAGLNLFISLNESEFSDVESYDAKPTVKLVEALIKYEEFVKVRVASLQTRLRLSMRAVTRHLDECGVCLQDAAIIDGGVIRCLFCGLKSSVRDCAELFSDGTSVEVCPNCGRESVAIHGREDGDFTRECFCCGYFTGPELRWVDWRNGVHPIPRLHYDRSCLPAKVS
jgi:hypothetical protein